MADPPDQAATRPRTAPPAARPAAGFAAPAVRAAGAAQGSAAGAAQGSAAAGTAPGSIAAPAKRAPRPPIVLLVGDGEATSEALAASLKQRGLAVMTSPAERAVAAAVARAPDLVMLLGDAAQEGGQRVIKTLASRATTARLPVALLEDGDAASLDRRLRALRSGAIAVIERQASVDAMAARIGDLAWRVADHSTRSAAGVEVTLDELTAVIRKELGLLVPEDDGQAVAAPGREMAEAIQVFVERIRALVQRGDVEGARAALAARPPKMQLDAGILADLDDGATLALRGARVLLVHDDPSRADALAQELRARGSIVVVSGRSERGLIRGRELDPEVVLLDSGSVVGRGVDVVQLLARDVRLRWAAVLVVRWDEVWPAGLGVPRMSTIAARVAPHRSAEREIADRVVEEARFDLDVERIGPSRILRALAMAPHVLGVTALEDLGQVRVDLADGLVAGATADGLEGLPALAKLLEMSTGVLRIERRRAPSTANVFLPVEDALAMAGRESSNGRLSSPPPSATAVGDVRAPDGVGIEVRGFEDEPRTLRTEVAERVAPAVGKLDTPFAGVRANTPIIDGVPVPTSTRHDDETTEVNLAQMQIASRVDTGERVTPAPRAVPPGADLDGSLANADEPITRVDDPIADGLAALLEPESMAPTSRMAPRPRTPTPMPQPPPRAHARPVQRKATLFGVQPPSSAAIALAASAATNEDATDVSAVPIIAPARELTALSDPSDVAFGEVTSVDGGPLGARAPSEPESAHATPMPPSAAHASTEPVGAPALLSARSPQSVSAPVPTPAAVPAVRPENTAPMTVKRGNTPSASAPRSKLPLALIGGALLLGVAALIAWRFAGPQLIGAPAPPVTTPVATPRAIVPADRPTAPTPTVPTTQPNTTDTALAANAPLGTEAQQPTLPALPDVPPPDAGAPVVAQTPTIAVPRATPDAGPADAPALAAAEAQTLATALDHALAEGVAADPDSECERLTEEARNVADPARAAAMLTRAADLSARNPHPVEALARLYLRTGNAAGAVEWATKLVTLRRRRASFRVLLGDARRASGDDAAARSAYEEALGLDPDDREARQRLSQ